MTLQIQICHAWHAPLGLSASVLGVGVVTLRPNSAAAKLAV